MKTKLLDVKFECPDCGGTVLVEILKKTEPWQMTNVLMDDNGYEGDPTFEFTRGVEVSRVYCETTGYECYQCGYGIAYTEGDTLDWLKDHDMLIERKE